MSKKVIPSTPQAAALRNIANGNPPSHGLVGRSAHGVFSKTLNSLWRREWIGCHKGALYLTAAGQAALSSLRAYLAENDGYCFHTLWAAYLSAAPSPEVAR